MIFDVYGDHVRYRTHWLQGASIAIKEGDKIDRPVEFEGGNISFHVVGSQSRPNMAIDARETKAFTLLIERNPDDEAAYSGPVKRQIDGSINTNEITLKDDVSTNIRGGKWNDKLDLAHGSAETHYKVEAYSGHNQIKVGYASVNINIRGANDSTYDGNSDKNLTEISFDHPSRGDDGLKLRFQFLKSDALVGIAEQQAINDAVKALRPDATFAEARKAAENEAGVDQGDLYQFHWRGDTYACVENDFSTAVKVQGIHDLSDNYFFGSV
jgi:hypothetical protein